MTNFNFEMALTDEQTFRDKYLQFPKVFITGFIRNLAGVIWL